MVIYHFSTSVSSVKNYVILQFRYLPWFLRPCIGEGFSACWLRMILGLQLLAELMINKGKNDGSMTPWERPIHMFPLLLQNAFSWEDAQEDKISWETARNVMGRSGEEEREVFRLVGFWKFQSPPPLLILGPRVAKWKQEVGGEWGIKCSEMLLGKGELLMHSWHSTQSRGQPKSHKDLGRRVSEHPWGQ